MAVIKVPRTPAKAFDKNRPASDLMKSQIQHLEWAIRPAAERSPAKVKKLTRKAPKTEGEAAARIEALTRQLHPAGGPVAPAPDAPPARPRRRRQRAKATRTGYRAKKHARRRKRKGRHK
jgi:hypothetical protein